MLAVISMKPTLALQSADPMQAQSVSEGKRNNGKMQLAGRASNRHLAARYTDIWEGPPPLASRGMEVRKKK